MKQLQKIGFLFLMAFLISPVVNATHIMGGEITWECNGSGQYIFQVKVYRDCSGNRIVPNGDLYIHNYPTFGSPPLSVTYSTSAGIDISPSCYLGGGSQLSCANGDPESIEEFTLTSSPVTLNGRPSAQGWIISYDDFARNGNDNIQGQPGITLRAKMMDYTNRPDSCVDHSPQFEESPPVALACAGTPFTYNHNASDEELDEIRYEWGVPLNAYASPSPYVEGSNPSPVSFQGGFTFNSPYPGTSANPNNVPATLDTITGQIDLTTFTAGKYVSVVKVTAYKCGQAVAEIYRELQLNFTNSCTAGNNPPNIPPRFMNSSGQMVYHDTVNAGDVVNVSIQATDFEFNAGTIGQQVTLEASGLQFGTNFTDPNNGCVNPPCATLSSTPPISAQFGAMTTLNWTTACNHLAYNDGCVTLDNTYTFVFSAYDDACPVPQQKIVTMSITVVADSVVPSPLIQCLDIQSNGDVNMNWNLPLAPNNTFSSWLIYCGDSPNGPFNLIDSVNTFAQTNYTHLGARADSITRYYYVRSRSGCNGNVINVPSDTISTADFQLDFTVAGGSCINPTVQFVPQLGLPSALIASWAWDFGDGNQSSSSNPLHTYAVVGNFTVNLTVITINGCTLTVSKNINPSGVNADAGPDQSVCAGASTQIGGSPTSTNAGATFQWFPSTGLSNTTIANPTCNPLSTTTYTVIVTDISGCTASDQVVVNVGTPIADAGFDQTICAGSTVQIGGMPTGTSGAAFQWSPATGLNDPSLSNPSASPTVTTTYTVTVTVGPGCTAVDQMVVNVSPNPVADAGADQSICIGSSAQIGGSPTGPVGAVFLWDNGATLNNPTVANPTAVPTVTTTYTVTVTNGNGCTSTDQVVVTVDSPFADAGVDQSLCSGIAVTLGGTPTGPPGSTFQWDNGTTLSSSTSPNPAATPTVTTTYTVTVTSSQGCTATDQVVVTVSNPLADAGPDVTICLGDTVLIGASPTGPPNAMYSWTPNTNLSNATVANPAAYPTVTTTYTVMVFAGLGCSNSDSMVVTVLPNFTRRDTTPVCFGNPFTFPDGSTIASVIADTLQISQLPSSGCDSIIETYVVVRPVQDINDTVHVCFGENYTFPDGFTIANIIAPLGYTSVLQNQWNCDSTINTWVNVTKVDTSVTSNDPVLTSNAVNASYQWFECNNPMPFVGDTMAVFNAPYNGFFGVEVTQNNCVDTSACYLILSIGLDEGRLASAIKYSPNPTRGYIQLQLGQLYQELQLSIRDAKGRLVRQEQFNKVENLDLEIEGPRGFYFITLITTEGDQITIKVLKE